MNEINNGGKMKISAAIVPHPPTLIRDIAKKEEKKLPITHYAFDEATKFILEKKPEVIILISAHAPLGKNVFNISSAKNAHGNMKHLDVPAEDVTVEYDEILTESIVRNSNWNKIDICVEDDETLDHGSIIAISYLKKYDDSIKIIRIGPSTLSWEKHFEFGRTIAKAINERNRKVALIVSGDLSHKLLEEGPYGYDAAGPWYDKEICKIIQSAKLEDLLKLDKKKVQLASQCGLSSFIIMAGILYQLPLKSKLLSYEGPFGVGYAVATFEQMKEIPKSDIVVYAENIIKTYLEKGEKIVPTYHNDFEMRYQHEQAGVFISIHKHGWLRGCRGTLHPQYKNVVEELIENTLLTIEKDPRFPPVEMEEVDELRVSVFILKNFEIVNNIKELNPQKYVIVVESNGRQGILLPRVPGIEDIDQQIQIAKEKANILEAEDVKIQRFEADIYK